MRNSVKIAAAAALLLAIGAGWWLLRSDSNDKPVVPAETLPPPAPRISVQAKPGSEGLTLRGVVSDASGNPIGGARVFLASSEQGSLTTAHCSCEKLLLACPSLEAQITVDALLEQKRGTLESAVETLADDKGAFVFEHLAGVSFTVWAHAAGFGTGVKERAAPGEKAEVVLPSARSVHGIVRSEEGKGLPARVRIISRRLAEVTEVKADAQGRFSVDALGEGPFYVMATVDTLLPAIAREVPGNSGAVELILRKPRTLDVTLLAEGKAIDGTVSVTGIHLKRSAISQNGHAQVQRLPEGSVVVSAIAGELAAPPQTVHLKDAVTRVTLNLTRGGTIAVTALDDDENPVPNVKLTLLTFARELLIERALGTGELAILGPYGPGEYLLVAEAQGFAATSMTVTIKPGETPVNLTLSRSTIIAGNVVDEYGRPAGGVSVQILPLGRNVLANAEGHFVATVPSPGQYVLNAHHSDWGGTSQKVTAPKEDVVLSLESKASAEIVVTADGQRVEGAMANLIYGEGSFSSDRPSGADGVVTMHGLPPGPYELVAHHEMFLPSARQKVTLEDGKTARFTVELVKGLSAAGTVVDEKKMPVPDVEVSVFGGAHPVKTDADGHFHIEPVRQVTRFGFRINSRMYEQVGRNSYKVDEPVELTVRKLDVFRGRVLCDNAPVTSFRIAGREVTSADGNFEEPLDRANDNVIVDIEAPNCEPLSDIRPAKPDLGDFNLKRLPQFTGTVKDETGQPIGDAQVSCVPCDSETRSKGDGTFSLSTPSFPIQTTVIARKGRKSASQTVMPEQFGAPISLTLGRGTTVTGTVYSPQGSPIGGADVEIFNASDNLNKLVVTGADGTYSVELTPGNYQVVSRAALNNPQGEEPPVLYLAISGATQRLDIGAVPGMGTLSVQVVPRPGSVLWVTKGENPSASVNDVLSAPWAMMVFQPQANRFVIPGLEPGVYSLAYTNFRGGEEGPGLRAVVRVPQQGDVVLGVAQP